MGYVGLPLVEALGKKLKVIGLDINAQRITQLERANSHPNIHFTGSPSAIREADYVIICLPTPVTEFKEPNLIVIEEVTRVIGQHLKPGAIVILESTVYPGVRALFKPSGFFVE